MTTTDRTSGTARPAPVPVIAAIVVVATVTIGLTEAGIGAAWPEIRVDLGQSVDAQGWVLIAATTGFLLAALPHGWIIRLAGTGNILVVVAVTGILGSLAFAVSPAWAVLLAGAFVLGAAAGGMDSTLNSYAALHHSPRVISFMHSGFGVGATLAPLLLNLLYGWGHSWRWLWWGLAMFDLVLLGVFAIMRRRWHDAADSAAALEMTTMVGDAAYVDLDESPAVPSRPAGVGILFALNVACFFLYTGTEQTAGAWATTLMLHRGFSGDVARIITTVYWASLLGGRLLLGVLGPRLPPRRALALGTASAAVGASLIWIGGSVRGSSVAGYVLLGLSLAAVYPSLVALTPERLGRDLAQRAMGVQAAAAGIGVAVVPALAGVVAERAGIELLGPAVLVSALVLGATYALSARIARRRSL